MRNALAGRSIVLTRAVGDNASLRNRLTELGARVVVVPLSEVQPAPDGGRELVQAVARLDRYRWVALTSANGARFFAAAWQTLADAADAAEERWPAALQVAAIGPATAQVADAFGVPIHFVPSEATAQCLVEEFPVTLAPPEEAEVLAPLAELASSTVYDGLTAKGYVVDQLVAYRTGSPAIDPVAEPGLRSAVHSADVIVFASPSAVARFVDRFGAATSAVIVCIGPATAKRATNRSLNVAATANPHSEDGLFQAIQWVLVDDAS